MSTIYCNTVGCQKQAHHTAHGRHFCEACLRAFEAGINKAVDNLRSTGVIK